MPKVKKSFFCIKTKVSYKKGDEYKGKRRDISHLFYKGDEEKEELKAKAEFNKKTLKERKADAKKLGEFGKAKHNLTKKK